jgi:hypothetical protein
VLGFVGFSAVRQPKKFAEFFLDATDRKNFPEINFFPEKLVENKSFYINIRICGVLAIIMATVFLFGIIHAIIKPK